MKKIILIIAIVSSLPLFGQGGVPQVLEMVDRRNPQLQAERSRIEAQCREARVGNSLADPTISYDYLWGSPAALGKSSEMDITQPFDFPTLYSGRNNRAKALSNKYQHDYDALRIEILSRAEETCINIIALRQKQHIAEAKLENVRSLDMLYRKRSQAGDANAMELWRVAIELTMTINEAKLNRAELSSAENELWKLAGGDPMFADTSFSPLPVLPGRDEAIALWTENDPRRIASEYGYEAAKHDVGVAMGGSLPGFEIGYRRDSGLGEKFNGVHLGMSIPMFGNRNNVKRANAGKEAANSAVTDVVASSDAELAELYIRGMALQETLDEFKRMPDILIYHRQLETAHSKGQITLLQYCTEMSSLYRMMDSMIDTEREYRIVYAKIMRMAL